MKRFRGQKSAVRSRYSQDAFIRRSYPLTILFFFLGGGARWCTNSCIGLGVGSRDRVIHAFKNRILAFQRTSCFRQMLILSIDAAHAMTVWCLSCRVRLALSIPWRTNISERPPLKGGSLEAPKRWWVPALEGIVFGLHRRLELLIYISFRYWRPVQSRLLETSSAPDHRQ